MAAAAAAPPFVTATALRPARRAQEECPVLTKIKKDDCTDVKDLGVPFDSECPPCPPNSNEACPALRAVEECPADLPTDDCRADEFKDGFAVFPVGTLCSGRGECDTEKRLDNCGSKSVYEVMSIGKQCPFLELIPTSECPSSTEDLQTCHSHGDAGMIAGVVIACLVALCLCGAAVAYLAQNKKGSSAFKSRSSSRREAPPPPLPETELGTYSTYSDNVVKDADDPHRVDSNPIVDHAAGSEGDLDDVDIAPGGGDEY